MIRQGGVVFGLCFSILAGGCCDDRLDPLFGAGEGRESFRFEHLVRILGEPRSDYVNTIGERRARLVSPHLDDLLQRLPANRQIRLAIWERSCRGKVVDRFTAAFDPDTGDILEVDGRFAYESAVQLK